MKGATVGSPVLSCAADVDLDYTAHSANHVPQTIQPLSRGRLCSQELFRVEAFLLKLTDLPQKSSPPTWSETTTGHSQFCTANQRNAAGTGREQHLPTGSSWHLRSCTATWTSCGHPPPRAFLPTAPRPGVIPPSCLGCPQGQGRREGPFGASPSLAPAPPEQLRHRPQRRHKADPQDPPRPVSRLQRHAQGPSPSECSLRLAAYYPRHPHLASFFIICLFFLTETLSPSVCYGDISDFLSSLPRQTNFQRVIINQSFMALTA